MESFDSCFASKLKNEISKSLSKPAKNIHEALTFVTQANSIFEWQNSMIDTKNLLVILIMRFNMEEDKLIDLNGEIEEFINDFVLLQKYRNVLRGNIFKFAFKILSQQVEDLESTDGRIATDLKSVILNVFWSIWTVKFQKCLYILFKDISFNLIFPQFMSNYF